MARNRKKQPEVDADVLVGSRRRCCVCFALKADSGEKRGQIAHLDRVPTNDALKNKVFLCLEHHDMYDSKTSQSKGFTLSEMKRYRAQLERYVAQSLPQSDLEIARGLLDALDRPAYRTRFHSESSLPKFKNAIAESIATINAGKPNIREDIMREKLDAVVEKLVSLRATFDEFVRSGEICHCRCGDPECPSYMLSPGAVREMDRRRQEMLLLAKEISPELSTKFYD